MKTTKTSCSRRLSVDFENLEFGRSFSDHMLCSEYRDGAWAEPEIMPFRSISVSPAMSTLHYGQAVFEGLKAFRTRDGGINIFRPGHYFERFQRSCRRLCIPDTGRDIFVEGVRELVKLDREWVPEKRGCSLYLRPFAFASDEFLGLSVSQNYRFMIITSPVGSYYKEGINPVSLMTPGGYVRAAKGGLGAAKTPANYAASILPSKLARENGYTQVLWLDGIEGKYIEEVGTMNIFIAIGDELVTPALEGTILAGVTRDSVLTLARDWGMQVSERRISIDEIFDASRKGTLREIFGTGTAAVVSPVGKIRHGDTIITVNDGKTGPLAQRFYDEITGIQYGDKTDTRTWCVRI